ncbi:MAG: PEP-utilizing enzyme [Gemmatimonadaceae bacterium]|nr:PEP-utilizing enzyme [Gemmatimonadaceae bacterium]
MSGDYVFLPGPGMVPSAREVGGKAYNLARLAAVPGAEVPRWFALRATAFDELVPRGRDVPRSPDKAADLRTATLSLSLPAQIRAELLEALEATRLGQVPLAVRSSATLEDAVTVSFAGQFTSVLGVAAGDGAAGLWDAIRTVWASAFAPHALAYANSSDGSSRLAMAVLIQELIPARAAGVAFSMDPVAGNPDVAVVSAVYGLGESLVSGEADADTFRVRVTGADPEVSCTVATKVNAMVFDAGATRRVSVPYVLREEPAITDAQAVQIAALARSVAEKFGAAQDIEWAIAAGADGGSVTGPQQRDRVFLLQARPITATGSRVKGERRIWDNSNIIESYGGVTTPLTFSFARTVYEQVYRQFCLVMGVHEDVIERHRHVFANMLGLIRGRVYYNLLNWYRVLALLPGYTLNREFMERMMGVRERLAEAPPPPRGSERWRDAARVLRLVWGLFREHRRLDAEVTAFFARVDGALRPLEKEDPRRWSADDLLALYRRLENELLLHWRAPLVNDFYAMIWFGVLGRLVERWLPRALATLANDLLVGEGGIVSTEPARRIMVMAAIVEREPALRARFEAESDSVALLRLIAEDPAAKPLCAELDAYLARFGDRCMGELKLETITPSEDPTFVVRMIRAYVRQGQVHSEKSSEREREVRAGAEEYVRSNLGAIRRAVFFRVLRHVRRRIRDRENLRFERTRVFGTVRRIMAALGNRLVERGSLREPRDVFYLTVQEVFAAVEGTGVTLDLAGLAQLRQKEFSVFNDELPPPDRFETIGPPQAPVRTSNRDPAAAGSDTLKGIGCCPGVVRAPVRVVHDPAQAGDLAGRILVAERTDPGWTLLFPTAAGLLVQRGSLLSHSAIVAREVGLPCVVAIPGLMNELRDGEWVQMDGTTGVVQRIDVPAKRRVEAVTT